MANPAPNYAWQPADPLGEALHSLRMSGTFYCRSELTAPWGVDLPAMPESLMFHVVTSGGCWVELDGGESQYLGSGDFALLPHGRGHLLKSEPSASVANLFDLPRELISPRYEILKFGGGGKETHVICGAVCVKDPAALRVISLLPEIIVMQANTFENEWLFGTIRLMVKEAQAMRPGGDTVITRVSDILVVQAIRSWLERDPLARTGWLGALQDSQIGQAIAQIHRYPTYHWSVQSLAERIGMSRSAFAARFMSLVGEPPMHYVRQWRFNVAISWLRESDLPIAEIADQLGYQSEAAFSRAFKKFVGQTPGSVRRNANAVSVA